MISTLLIGRAPRPLPQALTLCPCLPRGTSITAGAAALCSSASGALPVEGVFEFPALGVPQCSPPEAPTVVPDPPGSHGLRTWLDSLGVSKLDLSAPLDSQLVVLSVNAGGLADKLHRLMALLFHVEPDVVLIQEAWTRFDPASLSGAPFHVEVTEPYDGGGLITLIHRRHKGSGRPQVKRGRHHLCVSVQTTPKSVLSVSNVHLPPKHSMDQRHEVVQAVAAFARA